MSGFFNPTKSDWLGNLPAGWPVPPLRRLARIENGRDFKHIEVDEGGYPVVGSGGPFARASAHLYKGPSVLLGRKGTIDRPQYLDEPFWAVDTSFFTRMATDVSARYFFYFALTIPFGYFEAGTALPSMTKSNLYTIKCPLPGLDEQRAIADFLDHETARIEALVAKKQRLLELLQEQRTALISQAVTKGLDPDAPMMDSGIEWLGEIPCHWAIERLAMFTDKITNGFVGPTRDILLDEGVKYLQSLHIKGNQIVFGDDYFVSPEWSQQHAKSILKAGDVLVVQTGDIGQVAVVPPEFEGANCHALIVVSPIRSLASGEYLAWVLNSHYGYHALKRIQTGALHPHLNCTFVREIVCPLPPPEEQAQLVDWIRDQNDRHDQLCAALERVMRHLVEYRSALVAAAVTGQIDVRTYRRGGELMPADHKEIAFEAAIEESLLTHGGFLKGDPEAFDRELALDRGELFAFLHESQPKTWAKLESLLGPQTEATVLDNLLGALADRGLLDVLRHGFKCYGKQLHLAYFAPAHGMNPETQERYEANRLTVTRQLQFDPASENTIDLVLSLNGLPVATAELKNPMTGQTWQRRRLRSTRHDRDPDATIFQLQAARPRALRRRPRRGLHDHQAGRARRRASCPSTGQRRWRRQPGEPRRLQDRLPLGGGAGAATASWTSSRASSTCRPRRRSSAARPSSARR